VDRRTLLLGSAGLVLAGCGGGGTKTPEPKPSGPNIVKPKAGTVVTEADTLALRKKLDAAVAARSYEQLRDAIYLEDYAVPDFEKRWKRRMANFERLDLLKGEWFVGVPDGRTRNGAGGLVEYRGDLVFTHTLRGCDGQPVVEIIDATFRKKSEDAPLEITHIGEVEAEFDPSLWDVAEIDAIEMKHAYIVFRTKDAKRAKEFSKRIDAGARRAFDVMPRPKGVDKIFYGLTWPAIDGKLWGGVAVGDADAHAYYHPFLDPEELAKGQRSVAGNQGLPRATGRVGLHEAAFTRSDFTDLAAHEGVHVLANQWYGGAAKPTWVVEGLAMWGEDAGTGRLMARDGGYIRSTFREFESKVALKGWKEFHDSPREYEYYACAAAVYEYLDREKGRDAVYEVAEAFYGAETREEGAKRLGRSEKDLLAATRKWLGV
jgi:hypothetical protein